MKKIYLLILFFSFSIVAQQAKIDSLYHLAKTTKNDSTKVAVYNQIIWKYLFSDKIKAKELIDSTEKIALQANEKFGYNSLLGIKGIYYDVNGVPDSAKIFFEKSLDYAQKNNFLVHQEHTLNNLGMYNWNQGNYNEALQYYFESIKVNSKIPEAKRGSLDVNFNNIGLIYQEMHLFDKAVDYHNKALQIRIDKKKVQGQIASYNNLGICYKELSKNNEAKQAFEKAISIAKSIDDKIEYYNAIQGLASVESLLGNNQKALHLYLESLNRPAEVPMNAKSKITLYTSLAEVYVKLRQPQKALEYGNLGLDEIKNSNEIENQVTIYKPLAEANYMLGNIEKGEYYNNLFYDKTIAKFKESNAKTLNEIEVKYQTAEKEKALAQEKVKVAERELKIKNKNIWLIVLGFLSALILLIALFFITKQRYKNKQLQREKELSEALLEIEHNNKLQEQRLAISRDLHDNIGSQLTFIISSIDSLKMFFSNNEDKINQKLSTISQFTRDTIQELRDTIWAMNKNEITVEDFETRISNFIEQANVSLQKIDFQFQFNVQKETIFNAKEGMNIYRIIQEAVNNAIKHANATKIEVKIAEQNNKLSIEIQDNGSGFKSETDNLGNGLNSMQKRASELNADFDIVSNESGTTVKLSLKNNKK